MKQENESTKELVKDIFSPDSFFEHVTQITKAHAYDILVGQANSLKFENASKLEYINYMEKENVKLKDRVKYLEELINEYTLKMKANLSGEKVDEFLKEQANDIPDTLFQSQGEAFPLKP